MKLKRVIVLLIIGVFVFSCKNEPAGTDCSNLTLTPSVVDENCSDQDGEITISAEGGNGGYSYSNDGGSTFQSSNVFSALVAGAYTLVVKDDEGCEIMVEQEVKSVDGGVAFTTSVTDAGCTSSNGEIIITATGGDGNYVYSVDGFTFGTDSAFSGLTTGSYNVTVRDGNGCMANIVKTYVGAGDVSYSADIKAIIMASCGVIGCHDGSSAHVNLNNYSTLFSNRFGALSRVQAGTMPKFPGTISSANRSLLICWLNDGAPNN